jgi:hypothetical protein
MFGRNMQIGVTGLINQTTVLQVFRQRDSVNDYQFGGRWVGFTHCA